MCLILPKFVTFQSSQFSISSVVIPRKYFTFVTVELPIGAIVILQDAHSVPVAITGVKSAIVDPVLFLTLYCVSCHI